MRILILAAAILAAAPHPAPMFHVEHRPAYCRQLDAANLAKLRTVEPWICRPAAHGPYVR